MKNIFKATLFFAMVILMSACGGSADAGNFVGKWMPELSKMEINLSDELPAEIKAEIEKGLKDTDNMAQAQKEMEKGLSIEFKEDGKLIVGAEGDSQEMDWEIDGNNLIVTSAVPGAPMKAKLSLVIVESTADMFTVELTGESILAQVEDQIGSLMSIDDALDQVKSMSRGMLDGVDLKKAIVESSVKVSFNKK